jgi:antitoxin component of MazEF toxin-antitoxin module
MEQKKRKLQKLGGSLYLSLPSSWISRFDLSKGGDVNVAIEDSGEIRIFPEKKEDKKEKRSTIDYDKHLFRNLIREYLFGNDIIEIKKQTAFTRKESKEIFSIINNLLNLEIIEEESNTISVQNLKSDMPLKKMIYRMYFLTKSMIEDLIEDPSNKEVLKGIVERDKLVGKFYLAIIMHQRELLTKRWSKEFTLVEILDLRLLIERIEQIGDEIKSIVNELLTKRKKIRIIDLKFLLKKYEEAYKAYEKQDTETAKKFWDSEKSDKQKLAHNEKLVRIYDHIKDITDLVI